MSILELARLVARVTGFRGRIETDPTRPDGTPRKLMDVSRLARLGWQARIGLEDGVEDAYRWFMDHRDDFRGRAAGQGFLR